MSRRILHIIDSLARTGTAKQLLVLGQGLAQRGFEMHVAALNSRGALAAEFRAAGLPVVELGRRWSHDPIALFRLRRLVSRLRPDVVHTWGDDAGMYGRVAARACGVRNLMIGEYGIDPFKGSGKRAVERCLRRPTDRFVSSSIHVRDWCVKNGSPADRFTVIPPGVPTSPPSDVSRDQLLVELRLPADSRLIGVVGRIVPEKRVKDLIWAADLLRVLHDNLRLLVIGDGPLRPQLEQYARLASDLEHIQFLGERADVSRIMPHLDVLWNADDPRGPSIAILEAMAAGVPVVASDTPINREFLTEGETGYLIPLLERSGRATRARHTDQIFSDADLKARLAAYARVQSVERFNAERMTTQYVECYVKCS